MTRCNETMDMHAAQLQRAIDRATAALAVAKEAEAKSAGPCVLCRWYRLRWPSIENSPSEQTCANPLVTAPEFSVTLGEVVQPGQHPTYSVRGSGGLCGPEGRLFWRKRRWWLLWLA